MTTATLEQRVRKDFEDIPNGNGKMKNRRETIRILTPRELKEEYPLSSKALRTVENAREEIQKVLDGKSNKIIAIFGPCSIQDFEEAYELAELIEPFARKASDKMIVVYRTYFQKPRTRGGWKGAAYDLMGDNSFDANAGLRGIREFLIRINELGLACTTEFTEKIFPEYIGDLIANASIGARTSESQDHRDFASGLPMPVGFKNSTSGDVSVAIDAVYAARGQTAYDSIDEDGRVCRIKTSGNPHGYVILRGGKSGPNYNLKLEENIPVVIDCSHGNSQKVYQRQLEVLDAVKNRILNGDRIAGIMMEVNLEAGAYDAKLGGVQRGKSRTDACLGIRETLEALERFYRKL